MTKKSVFPEQKIVDNIKALGIDMIAKANSGHPGIVLGAATILYTVYARHLIFNTKAEKWINRNRFILSAGHGSALLYATLYMSGFDINLEDLKSFRMIGSKTPGHPERGVTPGVEMTTGPLGQGLASAVGIAMAERFLATKYNIKKKSLLDSTESLVDYYTYVVCSDGDLMEGISYEAASLAGTLNLGKLIVLYDSNDICLDGKTNVTFTEDVLKRFEALGWHTQLVRDGDSIEEIDRAINKAKKADKPSLIEVKTIIGKGSSKAGTNAVHGSPLTEEDILKLKQNWGIREIPFVVSKEAVEHLRKMITERNEKKYQKWQETYKSYIEKATPEIKSEIEHLVVGNVNFDIELPSLMGELAPDLEEATRSTNSKVMNVVSDNIPNFIGGNADLASSTQAVLEKHGVYSANSYEGKNIYFGVREHAMGAILNGLALSSIRVFGGTFLTFSDYLKPAIRMACLMKLPVTYIFTHDSINVGPDGPTHQPIEQIAMLRGIPNLDVYRPADAREIVGVWDNLLKNNNPSALLLTRQAVPLLKDSRADGVTKGGYMVKQESGNLFGVIIATGSEVSVAVSIAEELQNKGINLRVISMPCVEIFLKQPDEYKDSLIPIGYKTIVIEAASSIGWHRFVYNDKYLMTIDQFGESGSMEQIQEHFQFNIEALTIKIEKLFK